MSRPFAAPYTARDVSRWISPTVLSFSVSSARPTLSRKSSSTAASRRRIATGESRGRSTQLRSIARPSGFWSYRAPREVAALFTGAQVFRQLEVAPRRGVKLHIPAPREDIRHAQLRHVAARRVREIGEQRAERERRHLVELGGVFAVLICNGLARVFGIEPPRGGLHAAAEPLFERVADVAG